MGKYVMEYRKELREMPLWGMKTFKLCHYKKVKVTKAQLKNVKHEGEWVITNKSERDFTLQRIQ